MPSFREQVRAIVCTAEAPGRANWSQVKVSCLDSDILGWKDGQLHVAEDHRGNFVLAVEYKNAPHKLFLLKNNVKSKTWLPQNPGRMTIALKDGTMIHLNKASPHAAKTLSQIVDTVSKSGSAGANSKNAARRSLAWEEKDERVGVSENSIRYASAVKEKSPPFAAMNNTETNISVGNEEEAEDLGEIQGSSARCGRAAESGPSTSSSNQKRSSGDMDEENLQLKRKKQELDENDLFFQSMSKMCKHLPAAMQASVRFEIHQVLFKAQLDST